MASGWTREGFSDKVGPSVTVLGEGGLRRLHFTAEEAGFRLLCQ